LGIACDVHCAGQVSGVNHGVLQPTLLRLLQQLLFRFELRKILTELANATGQLSSSFWHCACLSITWNRGPAAQRKGGRTGSGPLVLDSATSLLHRWKKGIYMNSVQRPDSGSNHVNGNPEEFDLVIIGSGVGSKLAAWTLAGQGQRVAVIEKKYVGGSCPNIACLPSKNIIHSAKAAWFVRNSADFGITSSGLRVEMSGVRERKRKMVSDLVNLHLDAFRKSGSELILGTARFVAPRIVGVDLLDGTTRLLRGKDVIVGTGSRAFLGNIPGLIESQPLTHVEALDLNRVPSHLLVIGGGYVGIEFSQAMRRFGAEVSIIDRNPRLMHRDDEDVSQALRELLETEGIHLMLNTRIKAVRGRSGQVVSVTIEQNGVEKTIEGTDILVASGRAPNTEGLGLEAAGVELTDKGYVKVNERLETTAPGVWALGDVAGSPQFTHIGFDDFRVIYDNIKGGHRVATGRLVPFCLFTDPEFARVGLSETDAKKKGISYRLFQLPMSGVLRARTLSELLGFMKALVAVDDDRILGFTMIGPEAGEVMSAVQIAMVGGQPYTALRDAILSHPTMAEGLNALFASPPSIHAPSSGDRNHSTAMAS
jgi:pyruvate/2-oxoglutarate dehydrogenase complex dihydrolipoamide dehydrogenase (E3) component